MTPGSILLSPITKWEASRKPPHYSRESTPRPPQTLRPCSSSPTATSAWPATKTSSAASNVNHLKAELQLDPYNFDANLQPGAIARQEQNHEQAHQCLARALRTRPGDPGVRYQLAVIAVDEGKPEEARQILESLVKES